MPKKIETAVFPLAGAGSRMLPATSESDKSMQPIFAAGKARLIIDHLVDQATQAGAKHLIMVTNPRGEEQIKRYFAPDMDPDLHKQLKSLGKEKQIEEEMERRRSRSALDIEYFHQTPGGKYGAAVPLDIARPALKGEKEFAYLSGDDFVYHPDGTSELTPALATWDKSGTEHVILGSPVTRADASRYGILQTDKTGKLVAIDEKPPIERVPLQPNANTSQMLLKDAIWDPLKESLDNPNPPGGEYYMTNVVNQAIEDGQSFQVHPVTGKYLDGGNPASMLEAMKYIDEHPPEQ